MSGLGAHSRTEKAQYAFEWPQKSKRAPLHI